LNIIRSNLFNKIKAIKKTSGITITLPVKNVSVGRVLIFKNIHASGAIAISRAGSDTIELNSSATAQTVAPCGAGQSLTLISDGSAKWICTAQIG